MNRYEVTLQRVVIVYAESEGQAKNRALTFAERGNSRIVGVAEIFGSTSPAPSSSGPGPMAVEP